MGAKLSSLCTSACIRIDIVSFNKMYNKLGATNAGAGRQWLKFMRFVQLLVFGRNWNAARLCVGWRTPFYMYRLVIWANEKSQVKLG
jgi:hypothetical protein